MRMIHIIADIIFAVITAVALWDLYTGQWGLDIRIPFLGVVLFYAVFVFGPIWVRRAVHGNRWRQICRLVDLGITACIVVADVGIELSLGVDEDTVARHMTYVAILAAFSIVAIRMAMAGRVKRRMARQTPEASE